MSKIQVTLEATKLRQLVSKRSYQNKDGQQVEVQEVKFELVPMKEENYKTIYEKDNLKIVKTHFAVAIQTKEEREAKKEAFYIGEGFTQVWSKKEENKPIDAIPMKEEPKNDDDDLPF